ncbi:MAG: hypothetical protein II462_03530, partial [Muribaculaceae bacterium]|nr:hypothetical protein [Muribaculaceae bacterium]
MKSLAPLRRQAFLYYYVGTLQFSQRERKKQRKTELPQAALLAGVLVVPPGFEPGTHGFSVHCSTT